MEFLTEQTRVERIRAAVAAAEQQIPQRTETIQWKGGRDLVLPIACVPLAATLLNPLSHRIRSHLEALGPEANIVRTDPFREVAQSLIARILRETPGFDVIKNALVRDGRQTRPGVITYKGVLVNANTRRVALADLNKDYIDVVVLPEDATEREITDLELELQMERDVKQEYTFTARLLFIEELLQVRGLSAEEVGLRLEPGLPSNAKGRKKARELVELEMRLLRIARDVISASGGGVRITDFDEQRQALIEIDQDFERTRQRDEAQARRVRDAQLAGMISEVDYRKLRNVDAELLDTYLQPALEEQPALRPYVEDLLTAATPANDDGGDLTGLDLLDDVDPTITASAGPDLGRLFALLASTPEDGEIALRTPTGQEVSVPRQAVVVGVNAAFTTAISAKDRDNRHGDALRAPMEHLREAVRAVDRAQKAYSDVRDRSGFDATEFDRLLANLGRAHDELREVRGDR